MPPLKWIPLVLVVALGCTAAWFAVHPAIIALDASEPNFCAMTFMWPTFLPIDMTSRSRWAHKYQLLFYKDSFTEVANTQEEIKQLARGIPVLFIPGNSGSPKQVRSMSAVASRAFANQRIEGLRYLTQQERDAEAEMLRTNTFDWFVADFNEALSAFSGDVLWEQTEFINDCVNYILSFYEKNLPKRHYKPKTVLLIGHSMGGAVARATFLAPNYKKGSVSTILTLSAPHNAGPLMTERAVASFYAKVNSYWRKSLERNSTDPDLREVAVLSLAGGFRDVQVSAELSSLEEIAPPSHQVSVLSTSIPHVWLSVDHLACVWCNQVMTALTRTMAHLVDPRTKQISRPQRDRMNIIRSIYESTVPSALRLSYGSGFLPTLPEISQQHRQVNVSTSKAKLMNDFVLSLVGSAVKTSKQYRWKMSQFKSDEQFVLHTSLLSDELSVYGCKETQDNGKETCLSLEPIIVPIPSRLTNDDRAWNPDFARNWLGARLMILKISDLAAADILSVIIATRQHFQEEPTRERLLLVSISKIHSETPFGLSFMHSKLSLPVYTQGHPLLLNFSVPDAHKLVSSTASVTYGACSRPPVMQPLLVQITPWLREERWAMDKLIIKFHSVEEQQPLNLFVLSDPACEVSISFTFSMPHSIHSFLRSFGTLLIPLIYFVVLATHSVQIERFRTTSVFPSFHNALASLLSSSSAFVFFAFLLGVKKFPEISALELFGEGFGIPKPWPTFPELIGVLVTAISAAFMLSMVVYFISRLAHAAASPRLVNLLQRCFKPPSLTATVVFAVIICVTLHSAVAIAIAMIFLLWPSKSTADNKNLFWYRHSIFMMYVVPVGVMFFSLVIWLRSFMVDWRILDSYKLHMIPIVAHIIFARLSSAQTIPRNDLPYNVSAVTPLAVILFALAPPYKVLDVAVLASILFVVDRFTVLRSRLFGEKEHAQ